jgi:hypothetical protein
VTAGLVAAAVALEFFVTGDVTVELALLAMNVGIILIGWDGRLRDTGLEANSGLGRSQIALGFVVGGFSTLFALYSVLNKHLHAKKRETQHLILGVILLAVHGVVIGLVARAYNETFDHYDRRDIVDQFSIVGSFAFPASLFAAAVAIAVGLALLLTGSFSAGFGSLTFITGVIEIGWAAELYNEGVNNRDNGSGRDFTGTVKAWEAWAIIAGFCSIVVGFVVTYRDSKATERRGDDKLAKMHGGLAILLVIVFYTTIGLTASLFQDYFFDRSWSIYGNNYRVVGGDNFGNQVSGFAWEHSIWAAAVAASFGKSLLRSGSVSGIAALTVTTAANLVGWAAEHHNIGSVRGDSHDLRGRARAWEALCLVSGVCGFLIAVSILRSLRHEDTRKVAAQQVQSPEARP